MEELRDLEQLATSIVSDFQNYNGKDFILPQIFKDSVQSIGNYSLKYNKYSAIIETSNSQENILNIYLPNQWFFIASYFTEYFNELKRYREYALLVTSKIRLKELNGNSLNENEIRSLNNLVLNEDSKSFLKKFITQYSWWGGGKTIDRNDFYVSTILSHAKLVNASQSYVADLCVFLSDKPDLVKIIIDKETVSRENEATSYTGLPLQQIYFGAPGTGKSHCVKKETESLNKEGRVIRTTFHPDSDYSTFVGAYKPTTESMPRYDIYNKPMVRTDGVPIMEQVITYEFVEQAFLQAYIDAWKNRGEPEFLIIEEINRGNCAQIFGDLFQLLDRGDDGYSEYAVRADKDLQKFICKAFAEVSIEDYPNVKEGKELLLPSNLFIRATMNTSDQSLFPIDSAFKRRWDWQYIPIAKGNDNGVELNWAIDVDGTKYDWWSFVKTINKYVFDMTNSEDKQLGFFFCKAKDNIISSETFVSKVIFYLWNDVFKDFGFDDSIFTDKDDVNNSNLSFDKFYNSDRTINIEKINIFLSNIGLTPMLNLDDNMINDFLDEDGNSSNTGTKDYSRYSINGEGSYNKGKVVQKAVEIYVENNSNMTADEIVHRWKTLDVTSVPHFVERKEEYDMRMQNAKDKNSRANFVSVLQGGVVCVSNQYNPNNIQEVIMKINAAGWDINIEKV